MVRVKICGITNIEDARQAAVSGADAIGVVFFAQSPRCVTPEQARRIVLALPPLVAAVGLFVNEAPESIREIASFCGLTALQLHGDEQPQECQLPPWRVIKALRVRDSSSLAGLDAWPVSALLLDAWAEGSYGGTGKTFDWSLATTASGRPIILAGGLTPENVAEAVRVVRPWAVDVSSGVEAAPGRKDPAKVAAFIRAAKGCHPMDPVSNETRR
ncbi:MAG: phosphoribosylanthranilate isomerase [Desulfuromonadales bacterium]|nr:phosphoribosylanthranilate isomerase [Desulfuromonadales bacterium]